MSLYSNYKVLGQLFKVNGKLENKHLLKLSMCFGCSPNLGENECTMGLLPSLTWIFNPI